MKNGKQDFLSCWEQLNEKLSSCNSWSIEDHVFPWQYKSEKKAVLKSWQRHPVIKGKHTYNWQDIRNSTHTIQFTFKKTNRWEYENTKERIIWMINGMKTNLEYGIKSTLFLQPTNTKAKRDMSNICNFLITEGLEKLKKTDQNNFRYREGWNKS